jgi:hypothetical protein
LLKRLATGIIWHYQKAKCGEISFKRILENKMWRNNV